MPNLLYRSENERLLLVYRAGTAASKVDYEIEPHSSGKFLVLGKRILVREPVDREDKQKQPEFVFLDWLDGKAAVAGIPLMVNGSETEVEGLQLFFQLTN